MLKVAESLGITEILTGDQKLQGVDSCSQYITKMVSEQVPVELLGHKRLAEVWNTFVKIKNDTKTN